jgi:WD40-like Beta Propeller Repeat
MSGSGASRRVSQSLASINPDGTGEKRLNLQVTATFPEVHVASRAPVVLYVRPTIVNDDYGPDDDIVLHNLVTSESKRLFKLPHGTHVSGLSSDGTTFAYAETDRSDPDYSCCLKRLVSVNTTTLVQTAIESRITPRLKTSPGLPDNFSTRKMQFSPDGRWLALRRTYYKSWPHAALLVQPATGIARQLGEGSDAAFITDLGNEKVLFTVSNSNDGPVDLFTFDLKTNRAKIIAKGGYLGRLAPDGRHVALMMDGPKSGQLPTQELWVIDESGPPRLISQNVAGDVSWSPDGKSLVYTTFPLDRTGPGAESLWIASVDGATNKRLTSGNFNSASRPAWIKY